jgi:hypothetical protein
MKKENMTGIILYGIAMAMGIATTVITLIGGQGGMTTLLGIGLACAGLAGLNSVA